MKIVGPFLLMREEYEDSDITAGAWQPTILTAVHSELGLPISIVFFGGSHCKGRVGADKPSVQCSRGPGLLSLLHMLN